jgi:hypothetical protein
MPKNPLIEPVTLDYLRKLESRIEALERAINSPEIVTQADVDALTEQDADNDNG